MKLNDIRIKVHHFGPLDNVSFKLAPMMIFTGMSSLGKSYANYLIYYFMSSVCNEELTDVVKSDDGTDWATRHYVFDLDEYLKELSDHAEGFMRKFLGDDELKCDVEFKSLKRNRTITIDIKKLKAKAHDNTEKEVGILQDSYYYEVTYNGKQEWLALNYDFVRYYTARRIEKFIIGEYIARAVILPPGRGAFVNENFSIKSEVVSNMNMYNRFFRDYDNGLNKRMQFRDTIDHPLSERLLNITSGGDIISVEGKQFLLFENNQKLALSAGASSVKDLSPWLFYLKNQWMLPYSFCMEEPEAHQHPAVTVQIADVMAVAMHQASSNMFHLTTHSDYLIQRLNQLVKLGSIRRKDNNLFKKICEERHLDPLGYLDANEIKAYFFNKDNKGRTCVEELKVSDDGIPMKSFFDVVRDLEEREDYINDALYRLEKK